MRLPDPLHSKAGDELPRAVRRRPVTAVVSSLAGHGGRTDPLSCHGRFFVIFSATSEPHNTNRKQTIGDAMADAT